MTTLLEELTTQHCTVERDDHVVILTMNRPEKRNALSGDMLAGLVLGYEYIDDNPDIRCAILTGAGGHFSSGADLVAMGQQSTDPKVQAVMARGNNPHWKALLRDYRLSKPLIAAVEGYAVAGGTEILQGTDIRIAGEGATFGVWEAKRGLFPLGGSACRLPRQIPYTQAMDILLACRPIPALEAKEMGLIGRVVPEGTALEVAKAVAAQVAANAPLSTQAILRGVARDRAHERLRRDAASGHDRVGGLRLRGRAGRAARVRGEARTPVQGPLMSEAAPGLPDSPAFAQPERAALATSLRALIDATMTIEAVDGETLLDIAREVDQLTVRLGGGRAEGPGYQPRDHGDYLPRSPIVGEASPLSPRIDWAAVDGAVEGRGVFGAAYEGPPGYVHGGWIACAFDEMLGIANINAGHPGMTARLTIHYRRPTPLFREVRFRAWVDRTEGRRIMSRAEVWADDVLTAEADGVFVQPRPELAQQYFGDPGFGRPAAGL